jgi:hypothetical protein
MDQSVNQFNALVLETMDLATCSDIPDPFEYLSICFVRSHECFILLLTGYLLQGLRYVRLCMFVFYYY